MVFGLHRNQLAVSLVFLLTAFQSLAGVENSMPDLYSELAPDGTRENVSANLNENIDPFSGGLILSHEDLVVPGNGGLDISIKRTYSSNNVYRGRNINSPGQELIELLARTPTGLGWTLHFGKVSRAITQSGCAFDLGEDIDNLNNPILETQDGSQQILHFNNSSQNGTNAPWVTKNHWVAYCKSDGFEVISPQGTKYLMAFKSVAVPPFGTVFDGNNVWFTTKVTDPNGNFYNISYDSASTGNNPIIDRITASDGRTIIFTYRDKGDDAKVRLSTIRLVGGPTWRYFYSALSGYTDQYLLDRVQRPDGSDWEYDYYNKAPGAAGDNLIERVTYPYGATTRYTYGYECMGYTTCAEFLDRVYSVVVDSKTNGGRDVTAGTWNYSYAPSNSLTNITTVTFPGGRYEYEHYGLRYSVTHPTNPQLWRVGLLRSKRTYTGSSLEQTETYTYDSMLLSTEDYKRPPYTGSFIPFGDSSTLASRLTQKIINRDGNNYVTNFQLFNDNINPHRIVESGQATKTNNLDYFPRSNNQNIVSQVDDESFGSGASRRITRSFDSKGNMESEEVFGVDTDYRYDSDGNISRRTNDRGKIWTFSSYRRGIPRTENQPEGVSISRGVDTLGGIDSETNGRGHTTTYDYDGLGRIDSVDFPRGSTANIDWSSTARIVTRGGYFEQTTFDGFGRPSCLRRESIYINYNYDALGRLSLKSYPGTSCSNTTGTTYQYDGINRLTRLTHNDASYISNTYLSDNRVRVRDERAKNTTYSYRSYGNPDQRELIRIQSPEGITTDIGRNLIGQISSVSQGGLTRTFNYISSDPFVHSETNPETGTTIYGRDAVGNMTSRRVGSSGTTIFTYDGLNQLTFINHPSGTPDVRMNYDDAGNLDDVNSIGGVSFKDFYFDANDNLTRERQVISGRTYNVYYTYTNLDHLATIKYPGGQIVSFNPDDLGRPTTVFPYVHDVDYFANGAVQSVLYANSRRITNTLDSRTRLRDIDLSGGAVDLRYYYDAANNTTQIRDFEISARTRNLGYDDINRLESASGSWGTGTITYKTGSASNIGSKRIGSQNISSYSYSGNKLSSVAGLPGGTRSYTYDSYANIETKTGGFGYTFDDASNLREIRLASATIRAYDYDGIKHKIRTTKNAVSTTHIYTKDGQLLADHGSNGVVSKEYAYLGNKLVANIAKSGAPPPDTSENTPIPINLNQTNSNSYGFGYGNSQHRNHVIVSFTDPEKDVEICAVGLGISTSTEVRVELNGNFLGYMSVGSSKKTCFDIAENQFISGTNQIRFIQASPGNTWGVKDIRLGSKPVVAPMIILLLGDEDEPPIQ